MSFFKAIIYFAEASDLGNNNFYSKYLYHIFVNIVTFIPYETPLIWYQMNALIELLAIWFIMYIQSQLDAE